MRISGISISSSHLYEYKDKDKDTTPSPSKETQNFVRYVIYSVHCIVECNMHHTGLHTSETVWPNAGLGSIIIGRVRSIPVV